MTASPVSIEHTIRDIALLRDLFVSRVMTLSHIASLHFDGRSEAAKKRVQKLKSVALVSERPRKAREPSILSLSATGFVFLRDQGHIADLPRLSAQSFARRAQVSDLTLRHELSVMDVKAALSPAIARMSGMQVVEFNTWPMLNQFDVHPRGSRPVTIKPDGFIRVEETRSIRSVRAHVFS